MEIRRSPAAVADADEIWSYIAADNPEAATRMLQRIADAAHRLTDFPLSAPCFPEAGENIRCLTVGPYRTFYQVNHDHILIIRVLHAARDVAGLFDTDT